MEKKKTLNKSLYVASTALSFVCAIFFSLLFDPKGDIPFLGIVIFLVFLFSPLGQKILKGATNYIRVLIVATFAIIASVVVGLIIPLNIREYYDRKGALGPELWLNLLSISSLLASIIIGLVLAYMIFKKYYKKQGQEEFSKKLFSVKITGRTGLIYKENGKTLMVDSEMLVGEYDMVIYADSINKWEPPNDNHQFTDEEKERIKSNIASELKSLRIDWS